MKTVIETTLPLTAISASATTDKVRKCHPGNMHLWWNRSPVDSSAAVLYSAIMDETKDDTCEQGALEDIAKGIVSPYRKGLSHTTNVITDPFSGFGGLTLAAQKLGVPVLSGDLNSVAVILTKAATEIPSHFASFVPVYPDAQVGVYQGANGLAEDVEYYGRQIWNEIKKQIGCYYPQEAGQDVFSWIWVRTVPCSNPACRCRVPLSSSFVLSKKRSNEYWAEPVMKDNAVSYIIHHGICPKNKETNKISSNGAKFQCPVCHELITDDYIKNAGKGEQLGIQIMAVAVNSKNGRDFFAPTEEQIRATNCPHLDDLPPGSLPDNTRWFSTPGFGLTDYKDLYTDRQLLLMTTLCDLINETRSKIQMDAVAAGMRDDKIPLVEGGKGAFAYSQAVSVYLALVVGKLANFQSTICTLDNRKGNIRAAFTRQAIPMTWTFAEGNPFSEATGNYLNMLKNVTESIANLPCDGEVIVKQQDATKMDFPEKSILFTELPYMDNVGYADLSDYFYIWLRRCLRDVYPDLFEKIVTSKEELSSIPEHYGGDVEKGKQAYYNGIRRMLKNFRSKASVDYPSMLFYEFSKNDQESIISDGYGTITTWENMIDSLHKTDFQVTAVWPVRTEKANEKYESIRVVVVFRIRTENRRITRRAWINELKRELPESLAVTYSGDIEQDDRAISALGPGLASFMKYKQIINADGSEMSVHDGMQIIWQEAEEYLNQEIKESAEAETKEV